MTDLPEPTKRRRRRPAVSKKARAAFLEALEVGYSVTHAAEAAGVYRRRLYELRDTDEKFREAWADAFEAGTDYLRDHLYKLAVEGVEEPLVSAGKVVGTKTVYDGKLLLAELRRRDPAYRDRPDVAVAVGIGAVPDQPALQGGVGWDEVAKVLADAGVDLAELAVRPELEAGDPSTEQAAEILDVEDAPLDDATDGRQP